MLRQQFLPLIFIMAASTTAEADTLKAFIPDLVTAICDCVQSVSDQCLAKGLISETTHRQVLESRGTSKEQARTLVLSVQNSTKTDGGCFEVFLDILNEMLPYRVKEKLLSEMRKDLADHSGASIYKALIPASQGSKFMAEEDRLQHLQQQGFLFGKYESSMKKYAHASAEKTLCEESLQYKVKESGRLRSNLELLKNQTSEINSQEIDSTVERLSAYETEMADLKERIETLEGIIREEDMQSRRGKSIMMVGTKIAEEQFAVVLKMKEEEHQRLLKEREDELHQKMQEEMETKIKDLQHMMTLQERDHKVALQEKELRIMALERDRDKIKISDKNETLTLPPDDYSIIKKPRTGKISLSNSDLCTHNETKLLRLMKGHTMDCPPTPVLPRFLAKVFNGIVRHNCFCIMTSLVKWV